MRRVHRVTVAVLGGAALLVLCGPTLLGYLADAAGPPWAYPFDDRPFEASAWEKAQRDGHNSQRGYMADDLIGSHLKAGMAQADVEHLLGPPDSQEKPDYFQLTGEGIVWGYSLGAWSGFRMDGDVLAIRFDNKGKLVNAWHYQT